MALKASRAKSLTLLKSLQDDGGGDCRARPSTVTVTHSQTPATLSTKSTSADLRKEYHRYCRLYSSEPLELVASPLEKASYPRHPSSDSTTLDLKGKGLRGVDCIALGKILANNSTITHLNLSDCLLLPQGFQALLEGLAKNVALRSLELRGNAIKSTMITALASFIRSTSSLRQLHLEWNCLGAEGRLFAEPFASSIAGNRSLVLLDLRNNQVSDEGAAALASALRHNSTLRTLDLRWNSVGVAGAKALWDSRQFNSTLSQLELSGNFVPEEITAHIQRALRERGKKDEILRDYSQRTKALSHALQKTEESYKEEIRILVDSFQKGQGGLKKLLEKGGAELSSALEQIAVLQGEKGELEKENKRLSGALDGEGRKLSALSVNLEKKVAEVEGLQTQNDDLSTSLSLALLKNKEQSAELGILSQRLDGLKDALARQEEAWEARLLAERSKWSEWNVQTTSTEQKEVARAQEQVKCLEKAMGEQAAAYEARRAEDEAKLGRLKMLLLTSKTEGEEQLAVLRRELEAEAEGRCKSLEKVIESLRAEVAEGEEERKLLHSSSRKGESDAAYLQREVENLSERCRTLEGSLEEERERGKGEREKGREAIRELEALHEREQKGNKELRDKVLSLQETNATASLRLSRLEKELESEKGYWETQIGRRDEELRRLKEEDMRRAKLLSDAFAVYMRSTAAATGLPLPEGDCGLGTGRQCEED